MFENLLDTEEKTSSWNLYVEEMLKAVDTFNKRTDSPSTNVLRVQFEEISNRMISDALVKGKNPFRG